MPFHNLLNNNDMWARFCDGSITWIALPKREWDGRYYAVQQVAPVVAEEEHRFVVITVYTFYF
jgi:hypothetical protein